MHYTNINIDYIKNTGRTNLLSKLIKEAKYFEYLERVGEKYTELQGLISQIKKSNLTVTEWINLTVKIKGINALKYLANPYFIGYGNPNSEILIIGKEKAFDANSNPELLFLESIRNVAQWKNIIDTKFKWEDSIDKFDPRFPRRYPLLNFKAVNHKSHTWNKYSKFLSTFIGDKLHQLLFQEGKKISNSLFEEDKEISNSFFNYCFCTELNSLPSKKTQNISTSHERKEFLKNEFYTDFKYVLIAGVSTLGKSKKQDKGIYEIFNAKPIKEIEIGPYGQGKTRKANLYKSSKQIIVTCAQLSGTAGWKKGLIPILGKKMRELNLGG